MEYGVFGVTGKCRQVLFKGSEKECEDFVELICPDWTWRDDDEFVWDVEIDELPF